MARAFRGGSATPSRRHRVVTCALLLALAGCAGDADETAPPAANGKIVFAGNGDGDFDLYVMDAAGGAAENLTRDAATATSEADDDGPAWSPDGTMVAFTSTRDHRGDGDESRDVYVIDADGTGLRRLTSNNAAERGVDWTPDGRVVFWRCSGGVFGCALFAVSPHDREEERLFAAGNGVATLAVSPDGSTIAFTRWDVSSDSPESDIVVADLDGDDERTLTSSPGLDGDPAWSPDGSRLVFASDRDRNGRCLFHDCTGFSPELYVMDADGANQRRLTRYAGYDISPAWSPDGRRIVFARIQDDADDYELYVIDADGGDAQRLTANGDWDWMPDW